MKNKGRVIGLVIVILIALGFIIRYQSRDPQVVSSYEKMLVDVSANKVFMARLKTADKILFPTKSPYSEGKNAYPVLQCPTDKTIFAVDMKPLPEGADPMSIEAEEWMTKCPICGRPVIDEPFLPEGQESMDVPGPIQIIKVPTEK